MQITYCCYNDQFKFVAKMVGATRCYIQYQCSTDGKVGKLPLLH